MKRGVCLLLPLIMLAGAAAAEIHIYNPPDKFRTFDPIIQLQAGFAPSAECRIESVPFRAAGDGSLTCGLVLNPGKNLVIVSSGAEEKRLRVLRLVSFPDVDADEHNRPNWARDQIVSLATLGIVEGYPDGNFYPGNPVTRGELATWLAKAKGLPTPSLEADVFFDVPKEHWRAPFVKAAVSAGLMSPYSNGLFGIDDPLTRAEAIALAGAAAGTDEAVTRAEAAVLVSRFAYAQEMTGELDNFEAGYTTDKFCGLNVAPAVLSFTASPEEVPVKQLTSLKLRAAVASRGVFAPLSTVTVDLTAIGGAPDAQMFDDGTHGDAAAGDLTYSLNLTFQPKTTGERRLVATATDRLGWEGKAAAAILIVE